MFVVPRALLVAAALSLGLSSATAQEIMSRIPSLSLTATGTVQAAPDTAIITVGVTTQGATAAAALTENNGRMRALIDQVMASGVPDRFIATSGFRIEPLMVYPPARDDGSQDPPRIEGYRVDNAVTVRIRELAKAGDLLDKVVQLGANQVQGISFVVDDERPLLDRARAEAVKAGVAKAEIYARAAGIRLKRLLSVSEQPDAPLFAGPLARMQPAAAEPVPLAPGQQDISVTVSMEWEIEQN
jgi:uncharacterized protein YggE